MDAVALREAAVAALREARDLDNAGDKGADKALEKFRAADAAWRQAAGLAPIEHPDLVESWNSFTTPAGTGMGGTGIPFPGGSGAAGGRGGAFSWGQAFIEERVARGGGIGFQAALLETGSTAVTVPLRTEPIVDPRRARFLFELLPEAPAPVSLYSYMQQNLRDLNAAVVAPGARKPTSLFRLERVDDRTEVIAHRTEPIDRFSIEDAPMLRTFIDDELRLGVNLALDQLVADGLVAVATPGETLLDLTGIRTAITELQLIELEPTAIAINPTDWQTVEEEAVATFAANSNMPAASEAMVRRLYGVPVTVTTGIAAGRALVGDFAGSAQLFVTGGVRIDVSDSTYIADAGDGEPGTPFETNTLVFRGERRANLAVGRPAGFILVGPEGS